MRARHLEILTEERSMEVFLQTLLSRILPEDSTFSIHSFQGKNDLLRKLQDRLRAYANWMPEDYRVVVVIDRDNNDCRKLKEQLETIAVDSGLHTRTQAGGDSWQVVNRVAIEELEAWYFGDWEAVCKAYPRVSTNISSRARYREPDAIQGGTWEAFERIMKRYGYFREGLGKVRAAGAIAEYADPARNCSNSFSKFHAAIIEATARKRNTGQRSVKPRPIRNRRRGGRRSAIKARTR